MFDWKDGDKKVLSVGTAAQGYLAQRATVRMNARLALTIRFDKNE
jgi:hypothetical protein